MLEAGQFGRRARGALLLLAALGCQRAAAPAAPPAAPPASAPAASAPPTASAQPSPPPPAVAEAKALFAQRCVMCHGLSGRGDGAAAASLSPKPRDYSDPAWQKATDDAHIRAVILGGGPAVGKSMMMPGNPDLEGKPEVVEGLVAIVRGFGRT